MTEAEWLMCTDPNAMLQFVKKTVSARKVRLFGVACCRRLVWLLLTDERSRKAVEVAEQFAEDGDCGVELARARHASHVAVNQHAKYRRRALRAAYGITHGDALTAAYDAWQYAADSINKAHDLAIQADLLRDIIGNPFRPVALDPAWLQWNGGTVRKVAQAIYDDRAFDRLPILADALEEAGCTDRDILDHCRSGGDHVRGCWAVDLLLGKE
jgi:hypothetical protein